MKIKYISVFVAVVFFTACTNSQVKSNTANSSNRPSPLASPQGSAVPKETSLPFPTEIKLTLSGVAGCLPHKKTLEGSTLECAYGLQTKEDGWFALDLSDIEDKKFSPELKSSITVTGYAIEDPTSKYDIKGVIKVTSITK